MSDEPQDKKRKMSGYQRSKHFGHKKANILEPGIKGYLATCNFREKDCVRECYNLLNEYYDDENQVQIEENEKSVEAENGADQGAVEEEEEEEDISSQLENNINSAKAKKDKFRFQQVETKTPNCVFIRTAIPNHIDLGIKIVRDIAETKKQKTRMLLRFIPIEVICKAVILDITIAAGKLFDKYFLNVPPTTFAIVVNKRYNNSFEKMKAIKELADIVTFKNVHHKVDLKNPNLTVIVEVIKGLCCLSVLPNYNELKKFNLSELVSPSEAHKKNESVEKSLEINASEPPAVQEIISSTADTNNDDANVL